MKNNQKGFTLIEMLVVVAIVGLLSSVVVIGVGGARQKARDTKRIADLRQIQTYLETQYTSSGGYSDLSTWPANLPKDPQSNGPYSYCRGPATAPFTTYTLAATLEDGASKPTDARQTPTCGSATCAAATTYCVAP